MMTPPPKIHVSRFPDALTDGAQPLTAVFTIHQHTLKSHRRIVALWAPDGAQAGVVDALIEDAHAFIPAGAEPREVPADFALECWVVR